MVTFRTHLGFISAAFFRCEARALSPPVSSLEVFRRSIADGFWQHSEYSTRSAEEKTKRGNIAAVCERPAIMQLL